MAYRPKPPAARNARKKKGRDRLSQRPALKMPADDINIDPAVRQIGQEVRLFLDHVDEVLRQADARLAKAAAALQRAKWDTARNHDLLRQCQAILQRLDALRHQAITSASTPRASAIRAGD